MYFVNIGGYRHGEFGEQHAWGFFGGAGKAEVKARAKQTLLRGRDQVHKDDLHDVDECRRVDGVDGWHVHLLPDADARPAPVTNGYAPLPTSTIQAWLDARRPDRGSGP